MPVSARHLSVLVKSRHLCGVPLTFVPCPCVVVCQHFFALGGDVRTHTHTHDHRYGTPSYSGGAACIPDGAGKAKERQQDLRDLEE
jgi:hypothetical protein